MRKFNIGDKVYKHFGYHWHGVVVGFYSTKFVPKGYCVESLSDKGAVLLLSEEELSLSSEMNLKTEKQQAEKQQERQQAESRVLRRLHQLTDGNCGRFIWKKDNFKPAYSHTEKALAVACYSTYQEAPASWYTIDETAWNILIKEMQEDILLMLEIQAEEFSLDSSNSKG